MPRSMRPAMRSSTTSSTVGTCGTALRRRSSWRDGSEHGMKIDERLAELGITLPGPFPPHDPLDAVVVHGGRARTTGQLPRNHDGVLVHPGTLGEDLTVEEGSE